MGSETTYWCDRCGTETDELFLLMLEVESYGMTVPKKRMGISVCGVCLPKLEFVYEIFEKNYPDKPRES